MIPIKILLVEDNEGDVRLTIEAFKEGRVKNEMAVVRDGVEAMDYLYRRPPFTEASRPDIILLDLNLPRKDGREVLEEVKEDQELRTIPIVILTTSEADEDILKAYNLHANCYITKPVEFDKFVEVVKTVQDFWFSVVKLPH